MGNATGRGKDRPARPGPLTWLESLTRLRRARYARAVSVALLAAAAAAQAVVQAAALGGAEYMLPLGLLALLATVPLAFYRPVMAAVAVTFGNAVALASYGQVTVAGLAAELIAACWLGLAGGLEGAGQSRRPAGSGALSGSGGPSGPGATTGRYLAVGLALPFLGIALAAGGRAALLLAALVPAAGGLGIAVWAGRLARTRTETGEALADTLLAHTARGERARIARELHDVVAHHISMIAVLSETGRLATPGLPEAGARRFLEIGDTARAGLTEMRRLLGVLREDAGDAEADTAGGQPAAAPAAGAGGLARSADAGARASRQPQPGLAQLTGLIDAARDASQAGTRLIISGRVAPLDPGVELAAYRIVQEALTNTRRHAPGAAVDVELRYGPDSLRVRVRDNGPGPVTAPDAGGGAVPVSVPAESRPRGGQQGGGHGLLGMRERAFSVGGALYAGAAAGGGFLIEAVLPSEPDPIRAAGAAMTTAARGTGAER